MRTPNRPTIMKVLLTLALAACPTPSLQSQPGDAGLWCPSVAVIDPLNAVQPSGPCVCTRRDAVPAGNCYRGTGHSSSATIGPEGGTLKIEREPGDRGQPWQLHRHQLERRSQFSDVSLPVLTTFDPLLLKGIDPGGLACATT